jgi:predicted dehydrogenase
VQCGSARPVNDSHPYADARTLAEHAELVVWEPDPERLERFRAEHPQARVAPDLAVLLRTEPDGVVLTVPTPTRCSRRPGWTAARSFGSTARSCCR